MKLKDKIVRWYRRFDVDANTFFKKYYFHKGVFRTYLLLAFVWLFIVTLTSTQGVLAYVDCPLGSTVDQGGLTLGSGCVNPLYKACYQDIVPCDKEFLDAGSTYGEPFELNFFQRYARVFIVWGLITAVIFNHVWFNVDKRYRNGRKKL